MPPKKQMLTLEEKVNIIKLYEREKLSVRNLAGKFNIGKTQAGQIVKDREEILKKYHSHSNPKQKRSFSKSAGLRIDTACYEWFIRARNKSIPLSGPIIRSKAKEIAESLGNETFTASAGWLEKFLKRHKISFKSISGEAASVSTADVLSFTNELPYMIRNYEPRNVYNADETGLFFRALPDKTFAFKGEKCFGGKLSKERLTILQCANMAGEKEKLVVIGKAARPRAFKNLGLHMLPVSWFSNTKAWMTSEIMHDWLNQFDRKMGAQKRKILLFLDNAASHPRQPVLHNIKICFLPPNTTAICQPLDQGIIQAFKVRYRSKILKRILSKIDEVSNANELVKSINVLDAIYLANTAWHEISSTSIRNCFRKAGFSYSVSTLHTTIDQGADFDSEDEMPLIQIAEMSKMMQQVGGQIQPKEFIDIDKNLTTEDESLDISIPSEVQDEEGAELGSDEEIEEGMIDGDNCAIKSYSEALDKVNQLKSFTLKNSDIEGFETLNKLQIHFENSITHRKMRQSVISDYFLPKNK